MIQKHLGAKDASLSQVVQYIFAGSLCELGLVGDLTHSAISMMHRRTVDLQCTH
jgi:hypothetical protein